MARKFISFNGALWLLAAVIVVWLMGWPLVMGAWAKGHWTEIPCHVDSAGRFGYAVGEVHYHGGRPDFWAMGGPAEVVDASIASYTENGTCWVNPKDPRDAVHYVDAAGHWGSAAGRAGAAGVLVGAVAVMTVFGGSRRRQNSGREPVSSTGR